MAGCALTSATSSSGRTADAARPGSETTTPTLTVSVPVYRNPPPGMPRVTADHLEVGALPRADREPVLDHAGGQAEHFLDAQRVLGRRGGRQQPGLLGQERVHPVRGNHRPGPYFSVGTVSTHPGHLATGTAEQPGRHRRGDQVGPGRHRVVRQPAVEVAAERGHPVVRRLAPGLRPVVHRQGLRAGQRHRAPPDHPALHRHLLPPARDHLVQDPAVDHAAVDVLRPGERAAFQQHHGPARAGQGQRGGGPRGARPDHDRVQDLSRHRASPPPAPRRRVPGPARPACHGRRR